MADVACLCASAYLTRLGKMRNRLYVMLNWCDRACACCLACVASAKGPSVQHSVHLHRTGLRMYLLTLWQVDTSGLRMYLLYC